MSEHDEASDVQVSDAGSADADLAAVDTGGDVHVITLRGADGFELQHLAGGCPAGCAVGEAAGRISRAMCETGGRWTCDVAGGALMLVERLGD